MAITYTGEGGYISAQAKVGAGVIESVFAGKNAIHEPDGWRVTRAPVQKLFDGMADTTVNPRPVPRTLQGPYLTNAPNAVAGPVLECHHTKDRCNSRTVDHDQEE